MRGVILDSVASEKLLVRAEHVVICIIENHALAKKGRKEYPSRFFLEEEKFSPRGRNNR